ncbi:serine/threonine protein kinase [Thermoproteota archaeon]
MDSVSIPIKDLSLTPYVDALCYPSSDKKIAEKRIEELTTLGVSNVIFGGKTQLGRLGILGKGCVSVVIKAEVSGKKYALKIRRLDANRSSMLNEADLLRSANNVGIGPSLHSFSNNFILMDIVDGEGLNEWIRQLKGPGSTSSLKNVIVDVLTQTFTLDQAGLDHGELSNLEKHVYFGDKVDIIDFETASRNRRVSNLTSAVQNIFIGGPRSKKVRKILRLTDINTIIDSARKYKLEKNVEHFEDLLKVLNLIK